MNRFVKQNLLLIIVMGVSSVIILALIVYSGIVYFQMSQCISETEDLRKKISDLIAASPAPVDGNKPLIEKDIELYTKLNAEISSRIGRPYQAAADRFVEVLMGVKKGESIEEARKKFVSEYNETVGKFDDRQADQTIELRKLERKYARTLGPALAAFKKIVEPLTQEPDLDNYAEEFAFFTIGIPRKMQGRRDPANDFLIYCRKYREKLVQMLGAKMRPEADSLGFPFFGEGGATVAAAAAPSPEGGEGQAASTGPFRRDDIPRIARHWDIIGDICRRINSVAGLKSLDFFRIRGITNGGYDNTFVARGSYVVSHYSFEVVAPLKDIRALAEAFAYDPVIGRFYIVRSVFIYAPETEIASAQQLLNPQSAGETDPEKKDSSPAPARRRGRRGAVVEEEPQASAEKDKEKELRAKWREEFEKREKSLPFYQRSGYGDVKLGGVTDFRAVFDVDHVELGGLY